MLGIAAHPGRHVGEDRFFLQVEPDHLRHERIGGLVVGDAGADRVGERDVARAVGGEQSRHAEHRILAEGGRVEERVVDAPVDHVDALPAAGRAHVHRVVLGEQVGTFHQLDAHLLREEGVFEVGAVVLAGREHGHHRVARPRRSGGAQRLQQQRRVVLHRQHRLALEQLGEEPHHHLAVLDHVRHARGRAQVVLEHVVLAVRVAHQVDAGDAGIDAVGQLDAAHFLLEAGVLQHLLGRDHARLEDLLPVVDVVQEAVERIYALLESLRQLVPLRFRDDARDGVERNQPFRTLFVAVDGEGDANAMEQQVGFAALFRHPLGRGIGEPLRDGAKVRTHLPIGRAHFVVLAAFQAAFPLRNEQDTCQECSISPAARPAGPCLA